MSLPSPVEACRVDLFTSESELREKYPTAFAERLIRLREMYNYWLANPSIKDRDLRDTIVSRYRVSQSAAYADISVIHQLVPLISAKSKTFHRERANEMLIETYALAKARKDTKTMERAASSYAKLNGLPAEDETTISYDDIVTQPFCPTLDVRVLGIKPIPDIYNYINKLSKELLPDCPDITEVEWEDADLMEAQLFAPLDNGQKDDPS